MREKCNKRYILADANSSKVVESKLYLVNFSSYYQKWVIQGFKNASGQFGYVSDNFFVNLVKFGRLLRTRHHQYLICLSFFWTAPVPILWNILLSFYSWSYLIGPQFGKMFSCFKIKSYTAAAQWDLIDRTLKFFWKNK